ncbi:MAG: hypothetical protein AB7I27_14210 [Bacteriovoracaceae bacterium]
MKKYLFILLSLLLSCSPVSVPPVWDGYPQISALGDSYETLHFMHAFSKKIISIGVVTHLQDHQDELVVFAQNQNGELEWKNSIDLNSSDRPWKSLVSAEGIFVVTETHLVKFSHQGDFLWKLDLSQIEQDPLIRDVEIFKETILVAGRSLYQVDLSGHYLTKVSLDQSLWDIAVTSKAIIVGGWGQIYKLNLDLTLAWKFKLLAEQNPPLELVLGKQGEIYALSLNSTPQESSTLFNLNPQGKLIWKKSFHDPDPGYKLPGFPKLRALPKGHLLVGLSQQPTRELTLLNAKGKVLKRMKSKRGIMNEIEVDAQGNIFVMGESHPEVYSPDLNLVAKGDFPEGADITSGALALSEDLVCVGAGVPSQGSMKFYTACYSMKDRR